MDSTALCKYVFDANAFFSWNCYAPSITECLGSTQNYIHKFIIAHPQRVRQVQCILLIFIIYIMLSIQQCKLEWDPSQQHLIKISVKWTFFVIWCHWYYWVYTKGSHLLHFLYQPCECCIAWCSSFLILIWFLFISSWLSFFFFLVQAIILYLFISIQINTKWFI